MHDQVTSVAIHAHSPQFKATMTGDRILCPSGAMCLAGVRRLRLLGALKRCGLCGKRDLFKRTFKCRSCKMVYHSGCQKRISAATVAAAVTDARPTANYPGSTTKVESPVVEDQVHATAGNTANPTTETPPVRVEDVRDILAADKRRRAVHAAEGRRRDVVAAAGSPANPTTETPPVRVTCVRDILAADRRRRAVQAAESRQLADRLTAATGTPAERRHRAGHAAESRRLAVLAATKTETTVREQPTVESSTVAAIESVPTINSASFIVVRERLLTACEYFEHLIAKNPVCRSRPPDSRTNRQMTRRDYKEMSAAWDASTFKRPKNNESARTIYSITITNSTIVEAADA